MDAQQFASMYSSFGGFDYAREEHYVVVVDAGGNVVLRMTVAETAEGWSQFRSAVTDLLPMAIAIETCQGPAVERLLEMGVSVYPMNPKAAQRYRDRKSPCGVKDDERDAWSFADGLRTDGHGWRKLQPEDEATKELRILCRDQITLIGQRTALVNALQQALTEYYPAALEAFDDWTKSATWRFILQFPTPAVLLRRGRRKWENFLHANGIWRAQTAEKRMEIFARADQFASPSEATTRAKSTLAIALCKQLLTLEETIEQYDQSIEKQFQSHPDFAIFDSLPGAGVKTKSRLLGEIGADRTRFVDAEALQCYAGTAPVTKQSGKSRFVQIRRACNSYLRNAVHWLAQLSRAESTWASIYYEKKRETMSHQAALRCLGNRWLKILFKMLQTNSRYDPELHLQNQIRHGSWAVQLQPVTP